MEFVQLGQEEDLAKIDSEVAGDSDIVMGAGEAQVEPPARVLANLRRMVNEPAFSDVVFLCNDGKRVYGSRVHLSGMSDVLKSMFMHVVADSRPSEIQLLEISSPVLLAVFEYLYTGTLLDYRPQTWTIGYEVIIASRAFVIPRLEKITRDLLYAQTAGVAEDLPKVASLLTEAVRFKDLCEEPDNLGLLLVRVLSQDLAGCTFLECLSEDAFDYLLRNSKNNSEYDDELSYEEYIRFQQVIRWIVYQSACKDIPSVDEFVDALLPPETEALCLCIDSDSCSSDKVETPHADSACLLKWNSLLQVGEKGLRQAVYRLLSNIDCRRIHPILVAKVVEPMKIISAEQIMSALRFHAFRRTMIFNRLESDTECDWRHGESYRVCQQGYGVQKTGKKSGVAVATLPMSRLFGVYQWRFVLIRPFTGFLEFGFIQSAAVPDEKGERLSDDCRARVLCITTKEGKISVSWKDGGGQWETLDATNFLPAVFTYNASEHTCSVSLTGKDYGTIWKNLPRATYYPAVSLGNSSNSRVHIELLSGFDVLYI